MGGFFSALIAKIVGLSGWILKLFLAVFLAAWDIIRDAITWPFDQLLDIAKDGVASIDVSGISANVGSWGQLPAEVLNIMGLIGVGTAITIITTAIVIRLVLQLIPFVRLGS